MRRLSDTITRLSPHHGSTVHADNGVLRELTGFGTNPGNLKAWSHIPSEFADGSALVVVLHGCTQSASTYDRGAGWSRLADQLGFAVLYPEQQRSNNANLCFNWFEPGDSGRGAGEPLSIVEMVRCMIERHHIDPARVFVTGLSAGGAMTSVMLATYPEVFAGGAIIAGLPYGTAKTVPQALERMRGVAMPDTAALTNAVVNASPAADRRPTVSVWHGTVDHVVSPRNADAILVQWQGVHGLLGPADGEESVAGHNRRIWRDANGDVVIEDYRIAEMGHGTPISTLGPDPLGTVGAHMLEAGISSTRTIAAGWRLDDGSTETVSQSDVTRPRTLPLAQHATEDIAEDISQFGNWIGTSSPFARSAKSPVTKTIEDALRSAGLMR